MQLTSLRFFFVSYLWNKIFFLNQFLKFILFVNFFNFNLFIKSFQRIYAMILPSISCEYAFYEDQKNRWHCHRYGYERANFLDCFSLIYDPIFSPKSPRYIHTQLKTLMKVKSWKPSTFVSLSPSLPRNYFLSFFPCMQFFAAFFLYNKNHLSVFGISRNTWKCGILFSLFLG